MELHSNEVKNLKKQVTTWVNSRSVESKSLELEATFGLGGQVDQARFLAVAQRLKGKKGYTEIEPKDHMTITIKDKKDDINIRRDNLKSNTRFTIEGSADIEEYCNNESLSGLEYTTILKTPTGDPNEDNLVIEEYDMKFKLRREEIRKDDALINVILSNWADQDKFFRLIRRWTFEGDGFVVDLSMVRSNKKTVSGAYMVSKVFKDENQNILNQPPTYEIEVELKHSSATDTVEKAMNTLIKAVGDVLRGIQRSTVLIRKSVKDQTRSSYYMLIGEEKFRGVKPHTLEMKNFISQRMKHVPNIRDGYNVTDKADGLRVLGFCDSHGELFMIDKAMNVYRTGLMNENCRNSLVDGEWITSVKDEADSTRQRPTQQLWLFDIYYVPSKSIDAKEAVDKLPFHSFLPDSPSRHKFLEEWLSKWNTDGPTPVVKGLTPGNRLVVNKKAFKFARQHETEIFQMAAEVLGRKQEYNTDGLIFTSNSAPLPEADKNFKEQFKWKPAEDNTIDFLVRTEKDPETGEDLIHSEIKTDTQKEVLYKTLILKVGSTINPACADPRRTILFEEDYPKGGCRTDKIYRDKSGKYKAVPFNPSDYADPLASICKIEIQSDPDTQTQYILTEKSQEPIRDRSIIEMRYDMERPDGWRWVPVRVRLDKTEKLDRGELGGSLNADFTADGVWKSIHNPITKGMITTGNETPTKKDVDEEGDVDEDKVVDLTKPYFERKANKEQLKSVEGLRNFHKHAIKGDCLLKSVLKDSTEENRKSLLDLAVGEGADINRWVANRVGFVYGIDISTKGITDSHRGAYAKYLNLVSENAGLPESQQRFIAPMIFGIGDASKNLENGDAGINDEEANILRSVFGKIKPTGRVPPFVEHQGQGKLDQGADVIACMFALHYFFKSKATFEGGIDDGKKVHGLLTNLNHNLKVGGYFIACFFDGQKVFKLLEDKNEGESVSGKDKRSVIWTITKQYSSPILPSDDKGFGLAIDNKFITIGTEHREYLVSYELLKNKMATIGCLPLTTNDLKAVGLPTSSETFEETHKRMTKGNKELYAMNPSVKQYSFLNRWCIFKRYNQGTLTEEEVQTLQKEVVVETKDQLAESTRPNTLAYNDTPDSGTAGPTPVILPVKNTRNKKAVNQLTILADGPPSRKPIASLATAMAKGALTATTPLPELAVEKDYDREKIFFFAMTEKDTDRIKTEEGQEIYKDAPRYLAPYSPFEITDTSDPANLVKYPSILHYVAAMEYKATKPETKHKLGADLFSVSSKLHRDTLQKINLLKEKYSAAKKNTKKGVAQVSLEDIPGFQKEKQQILVDEADAIKSLSPKLMEKQYSLEYVEPIWTGMRDSVVRSAYEKRYEKDAKFREILTKLRELENVLVYRPTLTLQNDDWTGVAVLAKRNTKTKTTTYKIKGENKLGRLLMKLGQFPGYEKIERKGDEDEE
jgi:hypothetical protein